MTETQEAPIPAPAAAPAPQQVAITPERNAAANKIASVFNSLDNFLHTLAHDAENGGKVYSKYLENSIMRLSEAANHAIKHVLVFGEPVRQPVAKEPPAAANDTATPVAPARAVAEAAAEAIKH